MADETKDKAGKRGKRFGRFEDLTHIASGGMGSVYKAYDPKAKCVVALKIMSPELAAKQLMKDRFKREAIAAANLHHDNIVEILEYGVAEELPYLALEFVDGKDLHDYISRSPGGRLQVDEARRILHQAVRALDHAHRAGIIHRDIKPSNFLIVPCENGPLVKLTDLGLARRTGDDDHRVTKVGTTLGTVDYMAPEQARDSGKADIRSDLYALGCTLFHMLTGKPPFPKGTMAEKLVLHMESDPPDLCKINSAVPESLGLIVQKLLAKKPRDRYQAPAELLEDLEHPDRVRTPAKAPPEKKPRKAIERAIPEPVEVVKSATATMTRKKASKSGTPAWLPLALGGGAVALVGLVLLIIFVGRGPPQENKPVDVVKAPSPKVEPIAPAPVKHIVGPPAPELKPLYQPVLLHDFDELAKDFNGPFTLFPDPPAGAKTIVVRRMPALGQIAVRSLAEAFAALPAKGAAVIEIHDQGPHFVPSLAAVSQRQLWIRAGAGIRPLLTWDGTGAAHWLTLSGGQLTLDNLDVAVYLTESAAASPMSMNMFRVQGGDFQARLCTFSVAGRCPRGIAVAQLEGAEAGATLETAGEVKARFSHCVARGADLSLLATQDVTADVLIDGTLAVGGVLPLLQHRQRDEESLTVRLIRSTLVSQQHLWRWQHSAGKGGAPRLKVLAWDTLLARSDASSTDGDLLHLAEGAAANLLSFRPVNCLFAGWRNLLVAGDKTCDSLSAWRTTIGHREGDMFLTEPWPTRALGSLDDLAPALLSPHESAAALASSTGRGAVGCAIGRLPPEPPLWKQRTFEKFAVGDLNLPESETPEIPSAPEGLYHGERLELGKLDLGLHIQTRLQTMKPGPRVVLRLAGKGVHLTSPLRFKGVEHVVIHCEQPAAVGKDKIEPLTLELRPGGGAAGLIDVDGGSLELLNARIRFENSRTAALPPHMIRVRGGDLHLQRCTLVGPMSKSPDSFQSLIACHGSGVGSTHPVSVTVRDSTLQCGKTVLELENPGMRLRCRGSLIYALGDAIRIDLNGLITSRPDVVAQFENNTIAHRQAFVHVQCADPPVNCQPIVLQAQANYFLDPFPDEPRQSSLVKLSADCLARGLLLWQGKGNVFARDRLQAYYCAEGPIVVKQPFQDWLQLNGAHGEIKALSVDALAVKGFTPDQPPFDRLAVPPTVRLEPLPGADLAKLGLVKKK